MWIKFTSEISRRNSAEVTAVEPTYSMAEFDAVALSSLYSFKEIKKEKWPAGFVNHGHDARSLKIRLLQAEMISSTPRS